MNGPSRPNALIWTNESDVYIRALEAAGLASRMRIHAARQGETPPDDVLAAADLILAWPIPKGVLARMPRLRWIQALSAGVEGWLARPDLRQDLVLTCARGVHRTQMPENILATIFHLTKHFATFVDCQRKREWSRRMHVPIAGQTLGIWGMGTIGQELARKAAAMEMRVIGVRRDPRPVPYVDRMYGPDAVDEMLGQSDYVLLLLPVTPHTENIMNAQRLAAMKPSAYLLNFARGALVVDDDLIRAVQSKTIAGAVLDVFRQEPLPGAHPFWTTQGILVLPHVGGGHPERDEIVAGLFVENTRRFLDGQPLTMVVDRARGY